MLRFCDSCLVKVIYVFRCIQRRYISNSTTFTSCVYKKMYNITSLDSVIVVCKRSILLEYLKLCEHIYDVFCDNVHENFHVSKLDIGAHYKLN